jgi:PAS domain S-box-containing protein
MDKPAEKSDLRILMLEDIATDAELAEQSLRDDGLVFTTLRVDTEAAFIQALKDFSPHIVLSDYRLPAYSGRAALEYMRRAYPKIPVIMLSGVLSDESAVELLKLGARDYVLKNELARLAPAIRRVLSEEAESSERIYAEQALDISEEKYRLLFEGSRDALMTFVLPSRKYTSANKATLQLFGAASEAEFTVLEPLDVSPERQPDGRLSAEKAQEVLTTALREGSCFFEWMHRTISGKQFPADVLLTRIDFEGKTTMQVTVRDITQRKAAEELLRRANRALRVLSAGNLAQARAASEDELLRAVTDAIVKQGGYRLAEVCYAEDDPEKSIKLIVWAGEKESFFWEGHPSWSDTEQGQLPIAHAIRSGTLQIRRDIAADLGYKPWKDAALAHGYTSNIALPLSANKETFGALSIYSSETNAFDGEEVQLLQELASNLSYGITTLRARIESEQNAVILRKSLEQSIQTIAATVESRDPYTAGHQRRVAELATAIAREMVLPPEQINGIHLASIIHDLGKINIPAEILSKPGKLTDIEFMLIKTHPQAGYDILKNVKFPWPIADIVLQHHERLDGSGYPQGLKGGQILLESRIVAVADVMEAMSSHRPYRAGLGIDAALMEIMRGRGSLYDPVVADICVDLFNKKGFTFSSQTQ